MKRISILLTTAILVAIIAVGDITAQVFKRQKHELSVYAGGGLSSLQYEAGAGKTTNGLGGLFGAGYTYFLNRSWGLGTGVEIAIYQSNSSLSNFSDNYDVQGVTSRDNYTYYYALKSYKETQRALYLNIPLMLHFQRGRKYIMYGALGGKVGIPVNSSGSAPKYTLNTSGYFPTEGRTYDDLPQYGFGTYNYKKGNVDLENFKLHFMLSAEAGMKWQVMNNHDLYTGIYFDYGLNNIFKATNDKTFVKNELSPDNPKMSPLLESRVTGSPYTEKIVPLAVGLKVRFTFLQ
jgi:hypothetical protein